MSMFNNTLQRINVYYYFDSSGKQKIDQVRKCDFFDAMLSVYKLYTAIYYLCNLFEVNTIGIRSIRIRIKTIGSTILLVGWTISNNYGYFSKLEYFS